MKKIYLFTLTILTLSLSGQVSVTLRVDVTDYLAGGATLDPNGMRVGGNFADYGAMIGSTPMANWNPSDVAGAMSDADGDNIWEVTIDGLTTGDQILYKFVNGDWGNNEGTDTNAIAVDSCGLDDGAGNINRILNVPDSSMGFTFCYDRCYQCDSSAASITENNVRNLKVSPNPTNGFTTFYFDNKNASMTDISVYDITGKLVDNVINGVMTSGSQSIEYNTSYLNSGIYIYKINSDNKDITGKLIVK